MMHIGFFCRIAILIFLLTTLCACIDDTENRADFGDADGTLSENDSEKTEEYTPHGIAVIGSDYLSSSVSIIDRHKKALSREGIIHSGSASPGLSIALSGDIVFPLTPDEYGDIVIIDRYPNSVLNFLDANSFKLKKQLPVSTGFASNPHDYLRLSTEKAYVTRYEKNPTPGDEEFDGGDDILIINPQSFAISGRIDLSMVIADDTAQDLHVRPDRMIAAAEKVWVSCNFLNGDFNKGGKGLLLAIDPQNDEIIQSIEINEMSNCSGLTFNEENMTLYVSCSGMFSSDSYGQLEKSGIVAVDLSNAEPTYKIIAHADDEEKRPYGFELALAGSNTLLAVRFGDMDSDKKDQLTAIDLGDNSHSVIHSASTPFGLGGFLYDRDSHTLYIGDADLNEPLIYLYDFSGGEFTATGTISSHPQSGLPPRHIAFF